MALASNVCNMTSVRGASGHQSSEEITIPVWKEEESERSQSRLTSFDEQLACCGGLNEAAAKACLEVTREYQRWDHWAGHGSLPDRPSNLVALYGKIQLWLLEHQRSYELLWRFSFSWRGCQFKWWVVLTLVQWCLQVYTFSLLHWWLCCLRRHSALRKAIWHLWWLGTAPGGHPTIWITALCTFLYSVEIEG